MPRTEEENQRIREERRKQILKAAVPVFARKGLAATHISDIATAGGISQGLIFRYFASKEEIFTALVEGALQSSLRMAEAALRLPYSPLEKLRWLLQLYCASMWREPDHALVVMQALYNESTPKDLQALALEQANRSIHVYQQLIVEGQETGEVVQGDSLLLALALGGCINGLSSGALYMPTMFGIENPPDPDMILRIIKA